VRQPNQIRSSLIFATLGWAAGSCIIGAGPGSKEPATELSPGADVSSAAVVVGADPLWALGGWTLSYSFTCGRSERQSHYAFQISAGLGGEVIGTTDVENNQGYSKTFSLCDWQGAFSPDGRTLISDGGNCFVDTQSLEGAEEQITIDNLSLELLHVRPNVGSTPGGAEARVRAKGRLTNIWGVLCDFELNDLAKSTFVGLTDPGYSTDLWTRDVRTFSPPLRATAASKAFSFGTTEPTDALPLREIEWELAAGEVAPDGVELRGPIRLVMNAPGRLTAYLSLRNIGAEALCVSRGPYVAQIDSKVDLSFAGSVTGPRYIAADQHKCLQGIRVAPEETMWLETSITDPYTDLFEAIEKLIVTAPSTQAPRDTAGDVLSLPLELRPMAGGFELDVIAAGKLDNPEAFGTALFLDAQGLPLGTTFASASHPGARPGDEVLATLYTLRFLSPPPGTTHVHFYGSAAPPTRGGAPTPQ